MNTGKTLFAQLMDFLPWTTFTGSVAKSGYLVTCLCDLPRGVEA